MKKFLIFALYFLIICKIACTFLFVFVDNMLYLSINSIITLLVLPSSEILYSIRIMVLSIVLLIWISIVVLAIVGVKYAKSRIYLMALTLLALLIDCVFAFIFSAILFKKINILVLLFGIMIITETREKKLGQKTEDGSLS